VFAQITFNFTLCEWLLCFRIIPCGSSRCLIVQYFGSIDSVVIPSSVTHLCKSCFSYCSSLSSLSFESGSNLQQIEESAFSYSQLKTIIIPSSRSIMFCWLQFTFINSI
jgi:hypothetical protein